ncbi:maleylpyruvate isomerase N-terminal domain-containing protein [Streptomyces sp. NPDC094049]|uniref:maleylpyruvate isomerase N-terminal domain-containing protein n=1 Tax=Streptomyces sp. NPDC094049 TaxID=3154987 RepID=UPI003316D006
MSDALTGALAEALAELVTAVAACDDEVLDPDTAVEWLELTGHVLGALPPADRRTLDGLFRAVALRHPEGPWRDELLTLSEGFGLTEDIHTDACEAVAEHARRFVTAVRDADPATPVPTRPGRTLADLTRDLGTLHHWAGHLVRTRSRARVLPGDLPLGLPAEPAAYADWLATTADATVRTLRAADPDAPVWSPGGDPHVRSYPARLLRETLVHLADAGIALHGEPGPADPRTAADAVDDLLAELPYVPRAAEALAQLDRDGAVIRLTAHDAGTGWTLVLGGGGFTWTRGAGEGPAVPAVRVDAGAGELLLLLHSRFAAADPRFRRTGDTGLLDAWLAATAL